MLHDSPRERAPDRINDNILDFSRIEAGRKEYDFRMTDIAELVSQTLGTYRAQIDEQGFTLRLELRIATDEAGEIYILTKSDGLIRRVASIR